MHLLVTFSFETYRDAAVRGFMRPPDRLVRTLEKDPAVSRLLVADDVRNVASLAKARIAGHSPVDPDSVTERVLHVRPWTLSRAKPVAPSDVQSRYRAVGRQLVRTTARYGISGAPVITFNPFLAAFADFGAAPVTYYARDDWLSYPPHAHLRAAHLTAYARMGERGIRMVAVSEALMERLEPTAAHAVVPNGIDATEWSRPAQPSSILDSLAGSGPVAAYAGSVDDRIDVATVRAVIDAVPGIRVVVAGPLMDTRTTEGLRAAGVTLPGHLDRDAVVALLRGADLCIAPHRRTVLTEAMSPLKLYEYLAAGRRVVATDLAPIRGVSPYVTLAEPGADFGAAVRDTLAQGGVPEADRLAFLRDNDWSARHRTVLAIATA